MIYSPVTWNDTYLLFMVIHNCGLYSEYLSYLIYLQIFVSREGGNKSFASVLAPGQHEGVG